MNPTRSSSPRRTRNREGNKSTRIEQTRMAFGSDDDVAPSNRRMALELLILILVLAPPVWYLSSQALSNTIPAPITPTAGDPLFFIARVLDAEHQVAKDSGTWIELAQKQLALEGVYYPFGRFSTGVDIDLSFLSGLLVSVILEAVCGSEKPAVSFNAAIVIAMILNTIAMWFVLSALRVRTFFKIFGVVFPAGYPFFVNSAALGHLGFLHYWPVLVLLAVGARVLTARSFDVLTVLWLALALYGCAYSGPQYAYFLALILPSIAVVFLVARRFLPDLPTLPPLSILLRYLATTGILLGALCFLFPLGTNYSSWHWGLVSDARLGARPISDLKAFAISPVTFLSSKSHFFVGSLAVGFVAALCLRPIHALQQTTEKQRWILVAAAAILVGALALAISPAIPPMRVILHAINPAARVYSRAVGLAIPMMIVLFIFAIDRATRRPVHWIPVGLLLLLVCTTELNLPPTPPKTSLSEFETTAHRSLASSPDDGFAIADLTSLSQIAYRAYGPFMSNALTGKRYGIVLPCLDDHFVNTFLFYGGKYVIAQEDQLECLSLGTRQGSFVQKQRFEDGSSIWSSPLARQFRQEWLTLAMVRELYTDQKWFPVVKAKRGAFRPPKASSTAGYRYSWRREQQAITMDCFGTLDQNPVFYYVEDETLFLLLAGPPLFTALQPMACDGIVTPNVPGEYVFDLEVVLGSHVTRVRHQVRVSDPAQAGP